MTVKFLTFIKLRVHSIQGGAFNSSQFTKLELLSIQGSQLKILYEDSFVGLTNLKELVIHRVKLSSIHNKAFNSVSNIEKLTLDGNGWYWKLALDALSLNNFFESSEMPRLKMVDIQNYNVSDTINSTTFLGLRNITNLLLTHCEITSIAPKSFDLILETVELIDLSSNKLKSLPQDIFKHSQVGEVVVYLGNNPWHCNCEIEPLRKLMKQSDSSVRLSLIRCQSPRKYAFQFLIDLDPICDDDDITPLDEWHDDAIVLEGVSNVVEPSMDSEGSSPQTLDVEPVDRSEFDSPTNQSNHFAVKCDVQSSSDTIPFEKSATLTSSNQIRHSAVRIENGQLFVDADSDFDFVGIELNRVGLLSLNITNGNIIGPSNCFMNAKNTKPEYLPMKTNIRRPLKHNQMYRFCWIRPPVRTVVPFDCITFFTKKPKNHLPNNEWVLIKGKREMIVVSILIAIFSLFSGIFIAFVMAKMFPKRILKTPPKERSSVLWKKCIIEIIKRGKTGNRISVSFKTFLINYFNDLILQFM